MSCGGRSSVVILLAHQITAKTVHSNCKGRSGGRKSKHAVEGGIGHIDFRCVQTVVDGGGPRAGSRCRSARINHCEHKSVCFGGEGVQGKSPRDLDCVRSNVI